MRFLIVVAALIAAASAVSLVDVSLENYWTEFKQKHNKLYKTNSEETTRYILVSKFIRKIKIFFYLN